MKRTRISILLLTCVVALAAANAYDQRIRTIKAEANPLLQRVAEKGVLHAYSAWARTYIDQGEYMQAADIYRQGVRDTFLCTDNQTVLAMELAALYNDHMLMHRAAQELLETHHFTATYPQAWVWHLRRAQTQIYFRQYDEALATLDAILATLTRPPYDIYATRGYLHLAMQHYTDAVSDLRQAQSMTRDSTAYYRIASNISAAHAAAGDCAQAHDDISGCLRFARTSGNDIDEAIYLRKRALVSLQCGDTVAAAADYRDYWQREKQYILDNFARMTEQQRLDYWANRKPLISGIFRLGARHASLLADVAVFRHQVALLGVHDTAPAILRQRLLTDSRAIQRCLNTHEAAVEIAKYYDRDEWRYAAIVLTKDNVRFVPLYSEAQLHNMPVGQRTLIETVCSTSRQDKNNLYRSTDIALAVWQPLLDAISGKSTVWFAPDGIFNMLAIEYLALPAPIRPDLRRLTSTAMLTRRATTDRRAGNNALLIGGLDYNSMDSVATADSTAVNHNGLRQWQATLNSPVRFNYLPGSRREIDSITDNLARCRKTYSEPEEQLKNELPQYNLVHLSTHGYSLHVDVAPPDDIWSDTLTTDNSLLCCGFALSGANVAWQHPQRDDGLLTARELCELDLRNVDMMVASACQSAQGKVTDEGPAGMLRGMKLAGVQTVMATLWPVDDAATTLFMQFFYRAWNNGQGTDGRGCTPRQALRIAQQQLREYGADTPRTVRKFNVAKMRGEYVQKTSPLYDAPYYWAPFILVDDIH